MRAHYLPLAIILLIGSLIVNAQQSANVGPEKGWLVLHGGTYKREYVAEHRFADLAGGPKASVVVILTPIDLEILTPEFLKQYKEWWNTELGLKDVKFLDTRDRKEAETDSFVAPLRRATGVWIMGGHNNNLVDIYVGTKTELEIKAVAERGGVVAGSSAGAMIQGSFLITRMASATGETSFENLDKARQIGFGLLKQVTVFPHFTQRKADKMMRGILEHYPSLLGIGIDENTAIIVHNDRFEVIGEGRVFIYNGKKPKVSLSAGQKYDLKNRIPIQ